MREYPGYRLTSKYKDEG